MHKRTAGTEGRCNMQKFIKELICRLEEERHPEICGGWETMRIDKAIEIVNQLAEEHKGGWIPVSERLPNRNEIWLGNDITNAEPREFIVMVKGAYVPTTGYYTVDGWVKDIYDKENRSGYANEIIAWMPLPEPYQSKED